MTERKAEPWMSGAAEALAPGVHLVLGWKIPGGTAMGAIATSGSPALAAVFAKGNADAVVGIPLTALREGGKDAVVGAALPDAATVARAIAGLKELGLPKVGEEPPQLWLVDDRR